MSSPAKSQPFSLFQKILIIALVFGAPLGAWWYFSQSGASTTIGIAALSPAGFTCGESTVKDADGNSYDTISIGSQCWMQQNMNVGTRIDVSSNQTDNATIEKWCYSDTDANCDSNDNPNHPDGGLYQWDEAMQYSTQEGAQGICPDGWHIPTHDEFTTLERAVCTSGTCATDFPYDTTTTGYRGTDEGTKLKPNGSSGFEGNIAGGVSGGRSFVDRGSIGYFWTSFDGGSNAWYRRLESSNGKVRRALPSSNSVGLSVRCLKDGPPAETAISQTLTSNPTLSDGLVGHWTFDGADVDWGSTTAEIKDRSGQGNHMDTIPTMSKDAATGGVLGQALHFRNIEPNDPSQADCMQRENNASIQALSSLTAATWVRPDRDDFGDWN